jgi:hypothetical protein
MLGCTFNEYKDCFDENLAKYLEAYEDNTPILFLSNQMRLYSHYQFELQKISNMLVINGEEKASEFFLQSNIFEGLKKIDIDTYHNILIEEKPIQSGDGFSVASEIYQNKRSFLKVRIDFIKLRNHLSSTEKIVEYIDNKYKTIEHGEQTIRTLTHDKQDEPTQIVTSNLDEVKPTELKSEDFLNPHKKEKDIIEGKLKLLKVYLFSDDDYNLLASSLLSFFTTNDFPKLPRKIMFKKLDRKYVGWVLKEIWQCFKTEKFDKRIIEFAVHNINRFEGCKIPKGKLFGTNIYKAFTTKPKSYKYR